MTGDDIRKLIGGYATGTLTDAERKLLFEAALDDQELFEELARDQALKEMLEEPGVNSRLLSKLADARPALAWWRRPVAWSAAAMLAAAAVTVIWLKPGKPVMDKPVEYANLQPAPVPASTPSAVAETKAVNQPPSAPASAARPQLEKRAEARRDAPATQNAVKEDTPKQEADKKETASREKDAAQNADGEQKAKIAEQLASAGRQFAEPSQSSQSTQVTVQSSQAQMAPQPPGFQQSFGVGGGGAGVGGRVSGLAAKRSVAPARFAFDYSIEADRHLVIKSLAAGYLSVASPSLIFPQGGDGHVNAGSTTRIAIPADVQDVVIVFSASAQNGQTVLADAVSSVRDSRTGTVEDPSPSANSKLVIQLRIQP